MALPTSGDAWDSLVTDANSAAGTPVLSDQDQDNNVLIMAKALVCVRTSDTAMCDAVRQAVMAAMETENGGRTLALGRELMAYVIAADLVGLDSADDTAFRAWLTDVRTEDLDGRTLIDTHEERPNNWGTHAGASRVAASIYLGDDTDVARCAEVFEGWLGNRAVYAGFTYGDLDWQADPANPVGINPAGATKQGHDIDGVIPDDQRRAGGFVWPPPKENYVWEALQGALAQAVILYRRGYDVWNWEDQALRRAVVWLHEEASYPAEGDDEWLPHIVNYYYGTSFPAAVPASYGKNAGYTDWTHP
ncbi:MAG: alginate lyase family protein [Deltaproteobacteria bacterium]|nr:alginate lyase family protein [Deltaproteobacteria bacterium]MBW2536796.1 alginate lyase family protein [Deltaproteobacteria bacterium]